MSFLTGKCFLSHVRGGRQSRYGPDLHEETGLRR
jgi:hypothetical protein